MWPLLPRSVPRWMGNRSIGAHWWWARRLKYSPRPPAVPPWALGVVLRALSQLSLKHLASVDRKELSLKSALLLALASAKRIRDLHAFSVDSNCICLRPGGCSLTLRLRPGFVPNHYLPPSEHRLLAVCPVFWLLDFARWGSSDFGVPH